MRPFESKIPESIRKQFVAKVELISQRLGINPDWLFLVMAKETAYTLSPTIVNKISGAVGLIQFMPKTKSELVAKLKKVFPTDHINQLDFVEAYLTTYKGRMKSFIDVYFAVFYPAAIGKPDDWVIGITVSEARAKSIALQNKGLDLNKNGLITVAEAKEWFQKGFQDYFKNAVAVAQDNLAPVLILFFFALSACIS